MFFCHRTFINNVGTAYKHARHGAVASWRLPTFFFLFFLAAPLLGSQADQCGVSLTDMRVNLDVKGNVELYSLGISISRVLYLSVSVFHRYSASRAAWPQPLARGWSQAEVRVRDITGPWITSARWTFLPETRAHRLYKRCLILPGQPQIPCPTSPYQCLPQ